VPDNFVRLQPNLDFSTSPYFSPLLKFSQISSVGAILIHADRQTGRGTWRS